MLFTATGYAYTCQYQEYVVNQIAIVMNWPKDNTRFKRKLDKDFINTKHLYTTHVHFTSQVYHSTANPSHLQLSLSNSVPPPTDDPFCPCVDQKGDDLHEGQPHTCTLHNSIISYIPHCLHEITYSITNIASDKFMMSVGR